MTLATSSAKPPERRPVNRSRRASRPKNLNHCRFVTAAIERLNRLSSSQRILQTRIHLFSSSPSSAAVCPKNKTRESHFRSFCPSPATRKLSVNRHFLIYRLFIYSICATCILCLPEHRIPLIHKYIAKMVTLTEVEDEHFQHAHLGAEMEDDDFTDTGMLVFPSNAHPQAHLVLTEGCSSRIRNLQRVRL